MSKINVKIKTKLIKNGKYYEYEDVNYLNEPMIIFDYNKKCNYTIIIVDLDVINIDTGRKYIFLHMIKVNNNEIINKYLPPYPSINSGIHTYKILICKQEHELNIEEQERRNFNLNYFVKKNNLDIISCFEFKTSRENV